MHVWDYLYSVLTDSLCACLSVCASECAVPQECSITPGCMQLHHFVQVCSCELMFLHLTDVCPSVPFIYKPFSLPSAAITAHFTSSFNSPCCTLIPQFPPQLLTLSLSVSQSLSLTYTLSPYLLSLGCTSKIDLYLECNKKNTKKGQWQWSRLVSLVCVFVRVCLLHLFCTRTMRIAQRWHSVFSRSSSSMDFLPPWFFFYNCESLAELPFD